MADENMNVEEQQAPQLGLRDIATMVNLIDLVSRRGGFEGPELETVGGLRTRIINTLILLICTTIIIFNPNYVIFSNVSAALNLY